LTKNNSSFDHQLDVRPISTPEAVVLKLATDTGEKKDEEADAVRLKESLSALSAIHKGITKIQLQQKRDRHRLDLHSETNNSNYNSVFVGSIFETFIFIAVAVFQVRTSHFSLLSAIIPFSLFFFYQPNRYFSCVVGSPLKPLRRRLRRGLNNLLRHSACVTSYTSFKKYEL
jgi:hypothetical protein